MFIIDEQRQKCLNAIARRMERKKSILITANYGSGKTELLAQIKPAQNILRVRSLGSTYQILGDIVGDTRPGAHKKRDYLKYICTHPVVIIFDECQNLPADIFPYFKEFMDTGTSIILAGLPIAKDFIKANGPDVRSRLLCVSIDILSEADLFKNVKDTFEPDAFSCLYGSTFDMRVMTNCIDNCLDYAAENGLKLVDVDTVLKFIED